MAKYLIHHFPSKDVEILFDADNGMQLAVRETVVLVWGENPNKREGRIFDTSENGAKYLRSHPVSPVVADLEASFETIDKESTLIQPGEITVSPSHIIGPGMRSWGGKVN